MKLGIMQPYFFPYIGYWQLLNMVDHYIIYDDVDYIKGGWINRNKILINGKPTYINLPLLGAGSFRKINEIMVDHKDVLTRKNLHKIEFAYRKAPYFSEVFPLVKRILLAQCDTLSAFNKNLIQEVEIYLEIRTPVQSASDFSDTVQLKGVDRIVALCKKTGSDEYINAIGGMDLYQKDYFADNGIKLSFLKTKDIQYRQFSNIFYPNLSILDVMMFNSREMVQSYLEQCILV